MLILIVINLDCKTFNDWLKWYICRNIFLLIDMKNEAAILYIWYIHLHAHGYVHFYPSYLIWSEDIYLKKYF